MIYANIKDLIPIQRKVNKKVKEKLIDYPTSENYLLAFNVELFEYFNAVGTWKWWKHSHQINREKILDELADCFAFFLSLIDYENELALFEESDVNILEAAEEEINGIFEALETHRKNVDFSPKEIINDLITYIGTDNETQGVSTVERFAIAIYVSVLLFPNITWEEITKAYKEKSRINIERQSSNY